MRSISLREKPPGTFKLRSIDKHTMAPHFTAFWSTRMWRALANGDVQLSKGEDGTEYSHISERQTKTRSGADLRNVRPIKP